MSTPFDVTVVVPVHDGLPDLLEAIESVLRQTEPAREIVVVDDDSSDGSGDLVERRYGSRVRVIRGVFGSAAAARNAGCRTVTTEYIAFLDADDLWFPEKLAVARQRLAEAPSAHWFFSDGAFRTLDRRLHASWFARYAKLTEPYCGSPLDALIDVNFVLTSSVVVRRAAFEAVGGFDERYTHGEDLDLWIRLARHGLATASRRALVRYQHRDAGLSNQVENRLRGGARVFEALVADPTLGAEARHRARRRASLYHQKLGLEYLRADRAADARREFHAAWLFPVRVFGPLLGFAASLLPGRLFQWMRAIGPAAVAATPLFSTRHVDLSGWAPGAESRREMPSQQEKGQ